jgi:hypothetical protein
VVLAGLFLMHGLPAASCGTAAGASPPSMTAAAMAGHPLSLASGSVGAPVDVLPATPIAGAAVSAAASPSGPGGALSGMAGGVCVSTPPPSSDLAGLLALVLLAVGVVVCGDRVGPLAAAGRFRRGGGRAPPLAGSGLLVSLCISRT